MLKIEKNNTKQALIQKDVVVAATITVSLLVLIGGFISPELAVFSAGIFSLGYGVSREYVRRTSWEKTVDQRLDHMNEDIGELNRFSKDNTQAIKTAQKDIQQIEKSQEFVMISAQRSYSALEALSSKTEKLTSVGQRRKALQSNANAARMLRKKTYSPANDGKDSLLNSPKGRAIQNTLKQAIENDKFRLFFQPIVKISDQSTEFKEIYSRIHFRGEAFMPASRYMPIAKESGYISKIDMVPLAHALKQIADALQKGRAAPKFFINVSCASLKNGLFMSHLLQQVAKNKKVAQSLVFEIQQADFETMDAQTYELLKGLSTLGCSLSLDHVKEIHFALDLVDNLNVKYMKLNASILAERVIRPNGRHDIREFLDTLKARDITPILERVEKQSDLTRLSDFGFEYAQGFLFNKPTQSLQAA